MNVVNEIFFKSLISFCVCSFCVQSTTVTLKIFTSAVSLLLFPAEHDSMEKV